MIMVEERGYSWERPKNGAYDEQGLSRVVKNLKFLTSPQDLFE
jgi:hypothetical protein